MEKLFFEDELIESILNYQRIENEPFPLGLTRDQTFEEVHRRSDIARDVMANNQMLIDNTITIALDNALSMTDETADQYFALALRLFSLQTTIDTGMAYQIHIRLRERARANGDVDRSVRSLYWLGQICNLWTRTLFRDQALMYFREGASYRKNYFDIQNPETRLYICKCLGNIYVVQSSVRSKDMPANLFFDSVDEAFAFWDDPKVRALDPDFPWNSFHRNANQNIAAWIDALRGTRYRNDSELAERVYDSVMALFGDEDMNTNKDNHFFPKSRVIYCVASAKYYTGRIKLDEYIDIVKRLVDEVNVEDTSNDTMFRILHLSAVLLFLMNESPFYTQRELHQESNRITRKIMSYCNSIHDTVRKSRLQGYIQGEYMAAFLPTASFFEFMNLTLRFTVYCHRQTYVHSLSVSEITTILAKYFINHQPELFIGMFGTKTKTAVVKNKQLILSKIRFAGFCHDAGKTDHLTTVAQCSRRIIDMEYEIIKQHASRIVNSNIDEQDISYILDVMQGHHKWYDGSCGYPEEFDNRTSNYKFVIDLVTCADSIDAATDNVGRSYASIKSLDQVIAEIKAMAGTRYSPIIADALSDPKLVAQIQEAISVKRKEFYYIACYADVDGDQMQDTPKMI